MPSLLKATNPKHITEQLIGVVLGQYHGVSQYTRPTNFSDGDCYNFTASELETFEQACKPVALPKVNRPDEIADIYCYEFSSDEIEAEQDLIKFACDPA